MKISFERSITFKLFLIISIPIILGGCNSIEIKKLNFPFLKGKNYHTQNLQGNVSSLERRSVYTNKLPSLTDTSIVYPYLKELFSDTLFWDKLTNRYTFLSGNKLHYIYDYQNYNKKHIYDKNGNLSEILTFGGQSWKFYFKEYFTYNKDSTQCTAEKYKMRNIENPIFDEHSHVDESDSLYLIDGYEKTFLLERNEYLMFPGGSLLLETWYDEGDTTVWQKTAHEKIDNENILYDYRFGFNGIIGHFAFITKHQLDKNDNRIKTSEYQLKEAQKFEKQFDFKNQRMNDLDLSDENFAYLKYEQDLSYNKHNHIIKKSHRSSDLSENGVGFCSYFYDSKNNWTAQISTSNNNKINSVYLRRFIYNE